jgi:hypothetical protein
MNRLQPWQLLRGRVAFSVFYSFARASVPS